MDISNLKKLSGEIFKLSQEISFQKHEIAVCTLDRPKLLPEMYKKYMESHKQLIILEVKFNNELRNLDLYTVFHK